MMKLWPEMVEVSSRYGPPKVNFDTQETTKNDHFGSFSELSEPSEVGDYKKPDGRAPTAVVSTRSLLHCAIYGERMAGNGRG